jgi:hypothetical protein
MKEVGQSQRSGMTGWVAGCLLIACAILAPELVFAANPIYGWTKRMGGTAEDRGYDVVRDLSGNVYLTGYFNGTVDFATDFGGSDSKISAGSGDIFVTRINANGNYGWTKRMGGTGGDSGYGVSVDSNGNVYVTGYFQSTVNFAADFGGSDTKTSANGYDIFVTRINANGTYGWTKIFGGTGNDYGNSVSVDPSGNVYIIGDFPGTVNFAQDFGGSDIKIGGGVFVLRINANGTYGWTKSFVGSIYGQSISVDSSGNVCVTGYFTGTTNFAADFGGNDSKNSAAGTDIFVTHINANGTYGWTKIIGGSDNDHGYSVFVDSSGGVYVSGNCTGTVNFAADFGGSDSRSGGNTFVTRINADGTYGWTRKIGGSGGQGAAVDSNGNVYVTGSFQITENFAADFGGTDIKISTGYAAPFITRINANGTYGWTKQMGITGSNYSQGVTLDSGGNVYMTGYFTGTGNFASDFGGSDTKTSSASYNDIFLTKIINPPDTDNDGLPDAQENPSSCPNRTNPDSDGDGLCDGMFTVLGICAAGEDMDADGVVDPGESNPCNPDSDGDGVNDGTDCAKLNPAHWSDCVVCVDADGDGYGANCNQGTDCDDNAATGVTCHAGCGSYYQDADSDLYGNQTSSLSSCVQPAGYVANTTDCNDTNAFAWNTCATCIDADLDSWYSLCDRYSYLGGDTVATIGVGTGTWNYPLRTGYHDARTQVIYLASEIGGAGTITSVALDVSTIPGQVMNNFSIRVKHTALSAYSTYSWEGPSSGWTTAYQSNEPQGTTGWRTFTLSTPFLYNGTQNLMVDFSFNNSTTATNGYVRDTNSGQNRSLYFNTNSVYGDPLTWAGTTNPTPTASTYIPNVRFNLERTINGPDCDDTSATGASCHSTCANFYQDSDGDTYGNAGVSANRCIAPAGYVVSSTDCNDGNNVVYPLAPELCDTIDNQCSGDPGYGQVDEGCGAAPWDTDTDFLPNDYETAHAGDTPPLDPNNALDGAADFDGDGNSNVNEYWNGSDPWMIDPTPGQFENPGCYYWADADGDGNPAPSDLVMLKLQIAGAAQEYRDILPHGIDTLDLDRDGNAAPSDQVLLKLIVALSERPGGYPSQALALETVDAPSGSVAVGSTTHVTVSVHSVSGDPAFAPGFGVVFEVVSGNAVLLGGDGTANGEAAGNRYDFSMEAAAGARANVVVLVTGSGPVTIGAKIPECGAYPNGRWNDEVLLNSPVVINP